MTHLPPTTRERNFPRVKWPEQDPEAVRRGREVLARLPPEEREGIIDDARTNGEPEDVMLASLYAASRLHEALNPGEAGREAKQ